MLAAESGEQRTLRYDNDNQEGGASEGGEAGRQLFHHQAPDQHDHRQQEVQPGVRGGEEIRHLDLCLRRIVERQIGMARL